MFASFIVASAALCAAHSVHGSEVFDHQTEWAIELVNTFNVPVRIVHRESETNQWYQRHLLEPYASHGWHSRVGDEWCAIEAQDPEERKYDCQIMRKRFPRLMIFRPPEDQCGLDCQLVHDMGAGQCSVPEHRGERYERKNYRDAQSTTAILEREQGEYQRLENNKHTPPIVPKFTERGYEKSRLPDDVWRAVKRYYHENYHRAVPEVWPPAGNVINHWEVRPTMIALSHDMKQLLYKTLRPILQDWFNVTTYLQEQSVYGIRLYQRGNWLRNHVDTTSTHVASAIVHVDSELDDGFDWPLEVTGHDGILRRYTMDTQDLILYESASVVHGRPTKIRGERYANLFIHFSPSEKEHWDPQKYHR